MHYLILCILSSTGIFIIFKFLDRKNIVSYPVIVINYLLGALFGFLINRTEFSIQSIVSAPWLPISFLIGVLFIVMFFVIARSSQVAGISITSVASKISVVFPIVFSMMIDDSDNLTLFKLAAIITALIGVLMTVYTPVSNRDLLKKISLPLILFVGIGIIDSLVKFAQHSYVDSADSAVFSAVLFAIAFLTGVLILPFKKDQIKHFRKGATWSWGLALGIVNFGSIYLMVLALNYIGKGGSTIDSSIIFGMNNIGIVGLSVVAGIIIFSEKLRIVNWIGILISIIAIILFTLN